MKYIHKLAVMLTAMLLPALAACSKAQAGTETNPPATLNTMDTTATDTTSVKVRVETTLGTFTILLYGDTPLHRDNFVKLVNDGYYNGTLFHRVIDKFMVQAGDPQSRDAVKGQRLGAGGPDYTLEAEIAYPRHFHKRGALAAARQGDQVNPERRSSGSQFYIVTGDKLPAAALPQLENRMRNQQMQGHFNTLALAHMDSIRHMQAAGDAAGLQALQQQLVNETEQWAAQNPVTLPESLKEAYTTVGGAPHLDGQYTVFGEVLDGMDVIDRIEKVETDAADRPVDDIRIIKMEIVK